VFVGPRPIRGGLGAGASRGGASGVVIHLARVEQHDVKAACGGGQLEDGLTLSGGLVTCPTCAEWLRARCRGASGRAGPA
jgi:hypothetical protein